MSPTTLGPKPTIEGGLEGVEIDMQQNYHKEHLSKCKKYKGLNNEIKKLATEAFEEKFLRQLKIAFIGIMSSYIRQIIQHLHNTFGSMTGLDLQLSEERIKQPWNQD